MDNRFDLSGRVALITGGGSGLGLAIGVARAPHGASVAVLDIDTTLAQEAVSTISSIGPKALAIDGDVTDSQTPNKCINTVLEEFGTIDILVNNAGIGLLGPAESVGLDSMRHVFETNVFSSFAFSKSVVGPMTDQGGGSIINMASMAGLQVLYPDKDVSYHSAKASIILLTKALAVEWASRGIRVNAIAPGYMLTQAVRELQDDHLVWDYHIERTPLRRAGSPEDLQGAAVFLASSASSFVTGSTIVVDGGYTSM